MGWNKKGWFVGLAAAMLLSGCQTAQRRSAAVIVDEAEPWRSAASPEDLATLDAMSARWAAARPQAGRRGLAPLLDPQAALSHAVPAPGPYRCRLTRLVGRGPPAPSAWSFCFVGADGEQLSLTADVPARRVGGYLWTTRDGRRLAFLGGVIPAKGRPAAAYGEARATDAAGWLERIGEFRYRLALPGTAPAALDVIELVAAPRP
jgi:hypothetical protein